MKILLAGTPEFSVPIFEEIIKNFNVVAIVSQPDKPANRGYQTQSTPVKLLAQKYNIKLFQPNKIGDIYQDLLEIDYDVMLTCAFGQFIPTKILNIPKKGCLNIHGSLLPKYRGASPIQYSLLNGDKTTGITLMFMVAQMDAGDIIFQEEIEIDKYETSDTLFKRLCFLAEKNITKWLRLFENNQYKRIVQDELKVVLSPKLLKEDAFLDEKNNTTFNVLKKIKAFSSNPGAYTFIKNKRLKVYNASYEPIKNSLILNCKNGQLFIFDYQFESKKRIKIDF
ncbi:methionyl-tRNA formyltransferase [Mycoplasma leonicaptivi]|uniref:methionyl-tRNA formyltransferase n=1 Tax=Mycoplasma leonicaptivi TaxID=36742 RepID=UPI00048387B7|nr:methionyl-tRNA formyltransferase [Mycoplasma leonicaptivi]